MARHIKTAQDMAREVQGGNPVRSSLLLLLILAFLVCFFIWASLTEIDAVTRAEGRVVPSAEVQIVQPSEPGVITDIHVTEGALVDAGAPLITLDGTAIEGELVQAQRRVRALQLRIDRLRTEIDDTSFVPDPVASEETPNLVSSEQSLFEARRVALRDEIAVLDRQQSQRQQQVQEARARIATAQTTLTLVEDEIALIAPLVASGVEPQTSLIRLEGRRAEASGVLAEAQSSLLVAEAAAAEIDDRIGAVQSAARSAALDELARTEAELSEILVRLPAIETRLTRAVLTAPVRGVVNRLQMNTLGGLARAGDPLVEIVPVEDELIVEAYLPPSDVAFVHLGQDVRISITAYDPSRYGAIDGSILRVGADAVTRPGREDSVFVVEVQTSGVLLDGDDQPVDILPGMVATVDILSGRRTVLGYITEPIVRVRDTALRE